MSAIEVVTVIDPQSEVPITVYRCGGLWFEDSALRKPLPPRFFVEADKPSLATAPDETAARLREDIEEHLLFQHDTPDEGEALLRRCLPLLAPEAKVALADDIWRKPEDLK